MRTVASVPATASTAPSTPCTPALGTDDPGGARSVDLFAQIVALEFDPRLETTELLERYLAREFGATARIRTREHLPDRFRPGDTATRSPRRAGCC